ncbi:hypothetical protein VTK73DRAFT_7918 [Phialemonium thermophilum]|uniref:Uncharacterized protein n=1 Tax=Phialemonium thermophilum TaxID=223376 RepID=A0ABR3WBL5_9PEZI
MPRPMSTSTSGLFCNTHALGKGGEWFTFRDKTEITKSEACFSRWVGKSTTIISGIFQFVCAGCPALNALSHMASSIIFRYQTSQDNDDITPLDSVEGRKLPKWSMTSFGGDIPRDKAFSSELGALLQYSHHNILHIEKEKEKDKELTVLDALN